MDLVVIWKNKSVCATLVYAVIYLNLIEKPNVTIK